MIIQIHYFSLFTTFAVGSWLVGWLVGELESNAKRNFQLLGQKNVGQKILRPQIFGSKMFGQYQVSNS